MGLQVYFLRRINYKQVGSLIVKYNNIYETYGMCYK